METTEFAFLHIILLTKLPLYFQRGIVSLPNFLTIYKPSKLLFQSIHSFCSNISRKKTDNMSVANDQFSGEEIILFGVRLRVDPMRKSVSMNNLSEYSTVNDLNTNMELTKEDDGYASANDAVPQPSIGLIRERKRGVPWTEEEHKSFLIGLSKVGKGDWRGISKNYVKTRTPTQVASHAQKYFLRRTNTNKRRRRSSLFDITTDSVAMPVEKSKKLEESAPQSNTLPPVTSNINGFSVVPFPVFMSMQSGNPMENSHLTQGVDTMNYSTKMFFHVLPKPINSNQPASVEQSSLSLMLSLSSGQGQPATNDASFKNWDSLLSLLHMIDN